MLILEQVPKALKAGVLAGVLFAVFWGGGMFTLKFTSGDLDGLPLSTAVGIYAVAGGLAGVLFGGMMAVMVLVSLALGAMAGASNAE